MMLIRMINAHCGHEGNDALDKEILTLLALGVWLAHMLEVVKDK